MKNGMILAKKSTWRSRLDLDYLDETSTRKQSSRQHLGESLYESPLGKNLNQFNDYASKESLGQVHAGGFLYHRVIENPDGTQTSAAQLSNAERKKRIAQAWFEHLRKFPTSSKTPVIQHRLVFSMAAELHDKLVGAGINPDRVLHSTTKKMMEKFGERFHPGDSIGYAFGIHHDTDHLHIHVAICPRSKQGAYVGCSMSRSSTGGHKNQMIYLRSCFELENRRWEQILSSPQKLQEHLSRRLDTDKITFTPRLSRREQLALQNRQSAEAIRLQHSYKSIKNLERAIALKRQALREKRNLNYVSRLFGYRRPKLIQLSEKVGTQIDRRSLREMQQHLFKIKQNYRIHHKRYTQIYQSHGHHSTVTHYHQQANVLGVRSL